MIKIGGCPMTVAEALKVLDRMDGKACKRGHDRHNAFVMRGSKGQIVIQCRVCTVERTYIARGNLEDYTTSPSPVRR